MQIDVLLAITNSNPYGKCLSRQLFTITNSKSVAIKSKACGTVKFRAIPGLNQASELGEAVFPPAMIRKAIQNHI
jgi:hypothetical protein